MFYDWIQQQMDTCLILNFNKCCDQMFPIIQFSTMKTIISGNQYDLSN